MTDLPTEAVILASSAGCPNQAFKIHDRIYGFQFHMEINKNDAKKMATGSCYYNSPSQYTQPIEEMMSKDFDTINMQMIKILDDFAKN